MDRPATVKLILRADKSKADGTAPIWLRITANRKSRYVATGIAVEPRFWNETKQVVRSAHPVAPALNARLKEVYYEAGQMALDSPSAPAVKAAITNPTGNFIAYFHDYIAELDRAGRFWEWKKYKTTLSKVEAALGNRLSWKELDRQALSQFERYLRDTCGNEPNTIRKEMQRLRRVVRTAIRGGVIRAEADPFLLYDQPKAHKPSRRKLTRDELAKLENLPLDGDSALQLTRDAFLLAFYGGGVRFSDVCLLRKDSFNKGRLTYRMMKTGNPVNVPLPEAAAEIVKHYLTRNPDSIYLLPFLEDGDESNGIRVRRRISARNVVVNKNLKRLAKLAGIKEDGLSFHVARHSFADYARQKSGDVYAIMLALGHRDLQTTQGYLRELDQDAVDALAAKLW